MATQRTTRAGIQYPAFDDTRWDLPLVAATLALDALNALGSLAVTPKTVDTSMAPTGLDVKVAGGSYRKGDGTHASFAGSASLTVADNATTYLWLTDAGVLTAASAFPSGANIVPLAAVVAASGAVTSVTDARVAYESGGVGPAGNFLALAGGTMGEGGDIAVGTATGTVLATAAAQKLGFWGAAPATRPSGAEQGALTDSTGGDVTAFTLADSKTSTAVTDSTGGTASGTLGPFTNLNTLTDNTGGVSSTTLAVVSDTATANALASLAHQQDLQRVFNGKVLDALASLAAKQATAVTDLGAARTNTARLARLLNGLRAALVAAGLIKGAA